MQRAAWAGRTLSSNLDPDRTLVLNRNGVWDEVVLFTPGSGEMVATRRSDRADIGRHFEGSYDITGDGHFVAIILATPDRYLILDGELVHVDEDTEIEWTEGEVKNQLSVTLADGRRFVTRYNREYSALLGDPRNAGWDHDTDDIGLYIYRMTRPKEWWGSQGD